ncbi:MAG: DUF6084 family protein [Verrucomicrobiota bacterium]
MFDVDFQITGVEAAVHGLIPLMQFRVAATNSSAHVIHSILLHAQIQIQSPQRAYNPQEKENLIELFGTPERWGQTLRNRLWTSTDTTMGGFSERAEATFSVPCTYDLSCAATKYFHALEGGEVPLLFLFSGTIFYAGAEGRLQVQPISWNQESVFRMPLEAWRDLMEEHFPNSAWVVLQRDVFDRLYAEKRKNGDATWEQTIERLLLNEEARSSRPRVETGSIPSTRSDDTLTNRGRNARATTEAIA